MVQVGYLSYGEAGAVLALDVADVDGDGWKDVAVTIDHALAPPSPSPSPNPSSYPHPDSNPSPGPDPNPSPSPSPNPTLRLTPPR